jgi:hypothetical protein
VQAARERTPAWASVRECHPSSRLRRSQSRLSKVRATTVAKSPINAPYKNKNASGGGLEFSGVGAGAQSQTNSAPTPKAAPTPTANVIKPSRRYRNHFIGPEYEAAARVRQCSRMTPEQNPSCHGFVGSAGPCQP